MLPLTTVQRELEWQRLLKQIGAVEEKPIITRKSPEWVKGWDEGYELGIKVGIEAERTGASGFFAAK